MTNNKLNQEALVANSAAKASLRNESTSILVIDSGVGGLSVCQSILAQSPELQIIYFADSAYFPYGVMPEAALSERLKFIVGRMLALHQPKLVVLACNTVSTLMLPELRALYDIPFVGVVPAIKPAALLSTSKRIGLLATPATVSRPYTDQLIRDHADACDVLRVGSSELVIEAERLLRGEQVSEAVVNQILKPFEPKQGEIQVDTIVLGCTHFPLLKAQLSKCLPGINWVDSGEAIAKRVSYLLSDASSQTAVNSPACSLSDASHQFYFSGTLQSQDVISKALTALGFDLFDIHSFQE